MHAEVMKRYLFPAKDSKEPPHPWEYYPELFAKEQTEYLTKKEQADFEEDKIKRRAMFNEFNRRRQQGE